MPKSDRSAKPGYKNPPVEHQFSSTNQPVRRRTKNYRSERDLLGFIAVALDEEVSPTIGGKPQKMSAAEYIARSVVKYGMSGTPIERLRALQMFEKLGLLKSLELESRIISDLKEDLKHERLRNELLRGLHDSSLNLDLLTKSEAVELLSSIESAQGNCTCGAMHECEEAFRKIAEWRAEVDAQIEAESRPRERSWNPAAGKTLEDILLEQLQDEEIGDGVEQETNPDSDQRPDEMPGRINPDPSAKAEAPPIPSRLARRVLSIR